MLCKVSKLKLKLKQGTFPKRKTPRLFEDYQSDSFVEAIVNFVIIIIDGKDKDG